MLFRALEEGFERSKEKRREKTHTKGIIILTFVPHGSARELHRLHKTPILRTGPNELSVSSVEALGPLYNRNLAQRTRGPFYTISKFLGATNVLTTRNNAEHRVWRGLWDRAFTLPNMEGYTAKVEQHVDRFMHVIRREVQGEDGKKPKELNFTGLSDRFAFDV